MISVLVLATIAIFAVAYVTYGRFVARQLGLGDTYQTPAHEINDGVDYVPARAPLLLGQHFSAIAAAGPIVGPILAAIAFGWLPAWLWIILGAIFIGGVHDFAALTASVRHKAASVGEIARLYLPGRTYVFFLVFIWLALVYVIIAFTDITAQTFKAVAQGEAYGPGVAASSVLYLALAVVMGLLLRFTRLKLWLLTAVFLPLVLLAVWLGPQLPAPVLSFFGGISVKQWDVVLLIYCFVASVIPMWLLLQPRGYLGGWLLYLTIFIGLAGALFGGFEIAYPALNVAGLKSLANGSLLFPFLFITVACGACSGFHAIVSSGTTSKQLNKETDARPIGYGAMLLEGVVAVLALATVIMIGRGSEQLKMDPNLIYAHGLAQYLDLMGVSFGVAFPFALLAFSTFVYDTLDVSTRLARYILQELTGWRGLWGNWLAAALSLAAPLTFLLAAEEKAYKYAWPIFGTSNQMLASLTLLAVSGWLLRSGRRAFYTILPMLFMLVTTMVALVLQVLPFLAALPDLVAGKGAKREVLISGTCGAVLLVLGGLSALSATRALLTRPAPSYPASGV
ncbi:MAG: carbon starvation protein A [Planctomycetes bacterium]|jgi:carbon starvation protein|nr:carbon starvation protein A [Planctomycetota bacterium]